MGIIICGLNPGTEKKHACPFCGFESDDIEDFATGMCWDCVYSWEDEEDDNSLQDES